MLKIIFTLLFTGLSFVIKAQELFNYDDSKKSFDTIKCIIDTGNNKKIIGWAIVKENPYRRSIDPGFSNLLIDYGYNIYGCLLNDKKTKISIYYFIYKN